MDNKLTESKGFYDPFLDFFFPSVSRETNYRSALSMKTDIKETEKGYELAVDLPGIDKNNISVDYKEGYLTIKAEYSSEEPSEGEKYLRKERYSGTGSRSFYVGDIEEKDIEARFDNGVLRITLPYKEVKEPEVHKIEVK